MMQRFIKYIDKLAEGTSRGPSIVLALVCAVGLGYELASWQYGHAEPLWVLFFTMMLGSNSFSLASRRWLRVSLFLASTVLSLVVLVLLFYQHPPPR